MECRACAVVNDAGRRYCRACGAPLGRPCAVCQFFNAHDDRHCGGCGRRLPGAAAGPAADAPPAAYAPAVVDDLGFDTGAPARPAPGAEAGGVSPAEIDGLFESILDEEGGEGGG
jgi:hypothetical protein